MEVIVLIFKTGQLHSTCFLGNTFILNWHIKHICLSTDRGAITNMVCGLVTYKLSTIREWQV